MITSDQLPRVAELAKNFSTKHVSTSDMLDAGDILQEIPAALAEIDRLRTDTRVLRDLVIRMCDLRSSSRSIEAEVRAIRRLANHTREPLTDDSIQAALDAQPSYESVLAALREALAIAGYAADAANLHANHADRERMTALTNLANRADSW